MKNEKLFTPFQIGKLQVKNRIGMAPMCIFGMVTPDGCFSQRAADYYLERARGGAGLIITGYTETENQVEVSLPGVTTNVGTNPPRFVASAGEMVEDIHTYGCKIFLQLSAGLGRAGYSPWISSHPIAPSAIPNYWDPDLRCRALELEEITFLVERLGEGAFQAQKAGFDGVEIHAIHEGHLLDQFALALFNERSDRYGGDLEARLTIAKEIREEIRRRCGNDFPVLVRFGVKSFLKNWGGGALAPDEEERGRSLEEGLQAGKLLEEMGYDGFDADCGSHEALYWPHPPGYMPHGCYLPYVSELKKVVTVPILTAGRMDEPAVARKAVENGEIDMALLGRGFLADPQWSNKLRLGQEEDIRPCLGCHRGCLGRSDLCKPLACAVNPHCAKERRTAIKKTASPRRVMIIGGGPAGMEAARTAGLAGHRVQLYEKADRLGGHLIAAGIPAFKKDEKKLLPWYERQLAKLPQVEIHLSHALTGAEIQEMNPDYLIIATGSKPLLPPIPGLDPIPR